MFAFLFWLWLLLLWRQNRGWMLSSTCSSRRQGPCTWCWWRRPRPRAARIPATSPLSSLPSSPSSSGCSLSCRQCSLKLHNCYLTIQWADDVMRRTVVGLVLAEDGQQLSVVGHQRLSHHLPGDDQVLHDLQGSAHYQVVFRFQSLCNKFHSLQNLLTQINQLFLFTPLMGMISWGTTGRIRLPPCSNMSWIPWRAKKL